MILLLLIRCISAQVIATDNFEGFTTGSNTYTTTWFNGITTGNGFQITNDAGDQVL